MATYKSNAGAILQPGNQINKLSSYNKEGVHGWPGLEFYEQIGFIKVSNKSVTKPLRVFSNPCFSLLSQSISSN